MTPPRQREDGERRPPASYRRAVYAQLGGDVILRGKSGLTDGLGDRWGRQAPPRNRSAIVIVSAPSLNTMGAVSRRWHRAA